MYILLCRALRRRQLRRHWLNLDHHPRRHRHRADIIRWWTNDSEKVSVAARTDPDSQKYREQFPVALDIKVLEVIKMRWFGDKPLGRLVVHVKARDPVKWGVILRNSWHLIIRPLVWRTARSNAAAGMQLKELLYDSGKWATTHAMRRFFFPTHLFVIFCD